eukprot:155833_1
MASKLVSKNIDHPSGGWENTCNAALQFINGNFQNKGQLINIATATKPKHKGFGKGNIVIYYLESTKALPRDQLFTNKPILKCKSIRHNNKTQYESSTIILPFVNEMLSKGLLFRVTHALQACQFPITFVWYWNIKPKYDFDDEKKQYTNFTEVNNYNVIRSHNTTSDAMIRFDRIFQFNGDGDRVEVNLQNAFPKLLDSERTVSAWFRTGTDDRIIVSIGSKPKCPHNEQFAIAARKTDVILYGHHGSNDFIFSDSGNYLDNKWRHLVVTKKGSNAQLYINSKYVGKTKDHKYDTGKSNKQQIIIGGWIDNNRPFNGYIGDVRIYDRALKESEIKYLFDEGIEKNIYR